MTEGGRTYYEATAAPLQEFPALEGPHRADVCIIGAGFTGLGAALALAERGYSVAILEQNRVGSGASGVNGGQIHTGFRRDQIELEKRYGKSDARKLWELGHAAIADIDAKIKQHTIDAERREGLIYADHRGRFVGDTHRYVDFLRDNYGYEKAEKLGLDEIRTLIRSDDYEGGMIDRGGGHLHPLKYARGLAKAAAAAGAEFYEKTKALEIKPGARNKFLCEALML